ncbi:metallophosphoesterase [Cohnella thermotolerans]|uniref:metallophosphoesterase n=1 Tax=Cohnella thermotolerans TaxID=329858 RepID=UPI000684E99C|nr:metallophosphoesterase [Cohnella thermotolerans]
MGPELIVWGVVFVAALSLGFYSFFIEPRRLSVTRHEIRSPELPEGFDGVRIVQFSDTHLYHYYSLERFERLVEKINELEPDIVAFTGDLFDARRKKTSTGDSAVSPSLARIRAPLGKFAVYGNHDFGYDRRTRTSGPLLAEGGFAVLVNETRKIELPSGEYITVTGLDDGLRGRPEPERTLGALPERGFHLLLAHEPDMAIRLGAYPVDLQLSGHSHGGQVALPGFGAVIRTENGRKYVRGMFYLRQTNRRDRPYRLYVNRGIGTTRLRARLASVPELTVFTLRRGPYE